MMIGHTVACPVTMNPPILVQALARAVGGSQGGRGRASLPGGDGGGIEVSPPDMRRRAFVLLNRVVNAAVARLKLKTFRGADLLLLTTTGRTTGAQRTTPLLYLREPGRWVVVASNSGVAWEPGWWLNLRTGTPATVELGGASTAVTGQEVTGEERDRLWPVLNERVFNYAQYQAKVDRRLAVAALTPVVG
jgi:deazaflavin-dependent oxidoreductase (nitroreductase family)